MQSILTVQAIIAVLLLFTILIQNRASGLSATFGGTGATQVQRRGAEKVVYKVSVWLSVIFFGLSIAQWYF